MFGLKSLVEFKDTYSRLEKLSLEEVKEFADEVGPKKNFKDYLAYEFSCKRQSQYIAACLVLNRIY